MKDEAEMTPIQNMRGVGPALARHLRAHGVATVEDLAVIDDDDLCSIPGIGERRAAVLKRVALMEDETVAEPGPDANPADEEETKTSSGQAGEQDGGPSASELEMKARLAEAEAARLAAEIKAAKAEAKAAKAKRKAAVLAEEFAEARIKAKQKAKRVKAKAKKAIEKEKAKAQAILDGRAAEKKKKRK